MELKKKQATLFAPMTCYLGEGALWHPVRQSFFWLDILAGRLYEGRQGGPPRCWQLPGPVGTAVPGVGGDLVLAMQGYVMRFDPDTGETATLLKLDGETVGRRSNDGKCDPSGRFWLGTLSLEEKPGEGRLYCLEPGAAPKVTIDHATIPNGIAWSADGTRMYWIDSPERTIFEFCFDAPTGTISGRRAAIRVPPDLGMPDGMAIDEDDTLWVAHWGGGGVYHWNPATGDLLEKIEVPVPLASSCAFGGTDYGELLITTARKEMDPDSLRRFPASGSVFSCRPGVRGRPLHKCLL